MKKMFILFITVISTVVHSNELTVCNHLQDISFPSLETHVRSIASSVGAKVEEPKVERFLGRFLKITDIDSYKTELVIVTDSGERVSLGMEDQYTGNNLDELVECDKGTYTVQVGALMTKYSKHLGTNVFFYEHGHVVSSFHCEELKIESVESLEYFNHL